MEARRRGLPSAVITFPVHPRKVLQADYQPSLLSGFDEKVAQLDDTGLDYCISLPFTVELSQLSARDFMRRVLKEKIHVDTLLVGYDHRFGHDREEEHGEEIGMNVFLATEFQEGNNHDVSSSRIRRLLKGGHIREANRLLSYNYTLSGKIVEGYQVGRTIGYPTANMHLREVVYPGMLYIGTRPTLHEDSQVSVEVNLFDFEGNLYNQSMTVEFIEFVRPDEKFGTMEELVTRIHRPWVTGLRYR